jgi:hypothetical protein
LLNREFGGLIYKTDSDDYDYTGPISGGAKGVDPNDAPRPDGTLLVGDYHTHGDYSVRGLGGVLIVTSNPDRDDFYSDTFSPRDYQGIYFSSIGRPGYTGYLGTPNGDFKYYQPGTTNSWEHLR